MELEVKKTYKLFNAKSIRIYTIVAFIISIVLYELFYCNPEFVINRFINGENAGFIFSACRIAFYIALLTVYCIFSKKLIESALETIDSKLKRGLIYAYIPLMVIAILFFYIRVFRNASIHSFARVTLGALTLISGSVFLVYLSKDYIKNFIIGSFVFGLIFSISTEYYHALDEKKHFASAFNLACFNINYQEDPVINKQLNTIPHRTDGNNFYEYYKMKYDNTVEPNLFLEDTGATPTTYSRFLYIFPAIGILLAKTIGGTVADIFVAGRIFNLIFYIAIMSIALKIIPFKKQIFTAIALLPMVVIQSASYSIDGACVSLVSLFIAYVFKMYKMEKIKLKHWGILVLLFLLMLTAKSMAYLAVGALIFILPLWKIIKKQNKYVKIGIAVLAVLIVIAVIVVLFYIKDNMLSTDTRGGSEVSAQGQIEYLINNPLSLITLELNYMNKSLLSFEWLTALHHIAFFSPDYSASTFLVIVLFMQYISIIDDSYNFNKKEKAIFITVFLMVYVMTNIILYICFTPVGFNTIKGYQARYLYPIVSLLLVCLSNKNVKFNKGKNTDLLITLSSIMILMIGVIEEILMGRP